MTNTQDDDPANMLVRAGYLQGLATRLEGNDREMTLRASRSLIHAARLLGRYPLDAAELDEEEGDRTS